jgi:HD superfamily phosphohydrolase
MLCDHLYRNTTDSDLRGSVKEYGPTVQLAALLHDVGHGPFSHTLDDLLRSRFGISHEDMTSKIIQGPLKGELEALSPSQGGSIDALEVAEIALGTHRKHPYLNDLLHGEIDVDRMDYLSRDGYHAGIEYRFGPDSLIQKMQVHNVPIISSKELDILKKELNLGAFSSRLKDYLAKIHEFVEDHVCIMGDEGVVLCEVLLTVRKTMYETVYYDKASRRAEKMLEKAVNWMLDNKKLRREEFVDPRKFVVLDDFELFSRMREGGGFATRILDGIKHGRLYFELYSGSVRNFRRLREALGRKKLDTIKTMENKLADRWRLKNEQVVVDVFSVRAFERGKVFVKRGDQTSLLEQVSPLASSLTSLGELEGKVAIYTEKADTHKNKTIRDVVEVLGG